MLNFFLVVHLVNLKQMTLESLRLKDIYCFTLSRIRFSLLSDSINIFPSHLQYITDIVWMNLKLARLSDINFL